MICVLCDAGANRGSIFCSECELSVDRVLVHESGHAIMAVIQKLECPGICFDRAERMFCTPGRSSMPAKDWSYLFSAAGDAAERLIYGANSAGAGLDKNDFCGPNAPSFEESVSNAYKMLVGKKGVIDVLKSKLKARVTDLQFNFSALSLVKWDDGKSYSVLLSRAELEGLIASPEEQ